MVHQGSSMAAASTREVWSAPSSCSPQPCMQGHPKLGIRQILRCKRQGPMELWMEARRARFGTLFGKIGLVRSQIWQNRFFQAS